MVNKQKNKTILLGYRHKDVKLYNPKVNNKKRGLLAGLIILALVTPGTNWIPVVVMKGISKFRPLWMYQ